MPNPDLISLSIRGKITLCPVAPVRPCGTYVYQRTSAGAGNVPGDKTGRLQLRRWVIPLDPRTPAQLARRAHFAAAVAAWQAMPAEQRDAWTAAGKKRRLPGYQMHLSAFLKT